MIRIRVNMHPPDGRHFVEKDGTVIRAGSWKGVIRRVKNYRKLNKFKIGNVEDEVHVQACERSPSLCYDSSGKELFNPPPTLKSRVLGWLAKLAKVTPAFVDKKEAARRAAICKRCPMRSPMENSCATCKTAVKELRKSILKDRVPDKNLQCCSVLGNDLQTAVWIRGDRLNDDGLPNECWVKVEKV